MPPRRAKASDPNVEAGPRVLKKYPNRRLYDTRNSSYITLVDVKHMVLAGEEFEVRDAKTAEDLTRTILLQIILDEESGGVPLFSTSMLAQIIRFYGHSMQGPMGALLARNLEAFAQLQKQFGAGQAPMVNNLIGAYVEQSRATYESLQEQLANAGSMFPGFAPPKR